MASFLQGGVIGSTVAKVRKSWEKMLENGWYSPGGARGARGAKVRNRSEKGLKMASILQGVA